MKPKKIFWGVLFFFLGGFLLMNNLYDFTISLPELTKLWPVVLILLGVSVILKNNTAKVILAALSALLIAAIIFSIFSRHFHWFHGKKSKHTYTVEKFDVPYNSDIKKMSLDFESGVGEFNLSSMHDDEALLKVYSDGGGSNFEFDTSSVGDSIAVAVKLENIKLNFDEDHHDHFQTDISLHKNLTYDLELGVGAAKLDCDLESLQVRNLNLETGASDVKISFGHYYEGDVRINISSGAASVRIKLPENAAVEIKTELALSSFDFDGMNEVSDDTYRTDGFNSADKKFYIKLKGGVSSIDVDRR